MALQPNQLSQLDQTGLQEFLPNYAALFPLDRFKALQYFEASSFFQAAGVDGAAVPINNTEARMKGLDPAVPGVLESMPPQRPEFVLESCQEPHVFVIRKQCRPVNPIERPQVMAYYYIINNKIMQAPSAHQVTHARLERLTFGLQRAFDQLQRDLEPLTRLQRQHEARQATKAAAQQQQPEAAPAGATAPAAASTAAAAAAGGARGSQDGVGTSSVGPYVDLNSPSLGLLRAPLACPLPEVLKAVASAGLGGGGAGDAEPPAAVRQHHTAKDRERWRTIDRILTNQFASLQRIHYNNLPPEYLQKLHADMYGAPPPQQQQPAAAAAAAAAQQPQAVAAAAPGGGKGA